MIDYGYDDIEKWIDFLIELETQMLDLIGNELDGGIIVNIQKSEI